MQIKLEFDPSNVQKAIKKALDLMKPDGIPKSIAETLFDSTKRRIEAGGPGPDGESWPPLSLAYLLVKKGKGMLRESNALINELKPQVSPDGRLIVIGSNVPYAAIHQLGGTIKKKARDGEVRLRKVGGRTQFAKKSHKSARTLKVRFGEHTINIPARPYLGLSEGDKREIETNIGELLANALRG